MNRNQLTKLHIFVFLAVHSLSIWGGNTMAQNTIGIPRMLHFSKLDYQGGSQVWDITQDAQGRMYFANDEGLLTYDGTFWKLHPLPNKTNMRSIALGNDNRIYVGGQGELGYFQPTPIGSLQYVSLNNLLPHTQRNFADIWDIEVIGESVFFRVSDRMILQYRNNSFSSYPAATAWIFMKMEAGQLFAQDREKGLYIFRHQQWIPISGSSQFGTRIVSGIFTNQDNALTILLNDYQAFTLNGDLLTLNRQFAERPIKSNIFRTNRIGKDALAISTISDGCLITDHQGRLIQQISRKEGLQTNNVISIYQDRDGNLWCGLNNGISFIAYNSAFKYITPDNAQDVSVYSIAVYKGRLYVGTSNGVYMTELKSNNLDLSFAKGSFKMVKGTEGQTWRVSEINDQLLIAHTNGLYRLDQKTNSATRLSGDPGWLFLPLSAVNPSATVLSGTYSGLKRLDYTDGKFTDKGNLQGTYESFRFLTADNEGNFWSSHPYRGIYRIHVDLERMQYKTELFTEKDGLPNTLDNHVFHVRNQVVFATAKGLFSFNGTKRRFERATFFDSLLSDNPIRYLNEDDEARIWFCSGKTLGVIDPVGAKKGRPSIHLFPEITGKILSGFEQVYPYNRQNIFIASENGLIHLNYEKYLSASSQPTARISLVRAKGITDSILFAGYTINEAPTEPTNKFRLPSAFNAYHFEYSAPAYAGQGNIRYSLRLDGYDKSWSEWNSRTEKDYTNLRAGKYVFRVKSRDNLGHESAESTFSFTILPPWYQTIWAWVIYAMIAGLGIQFIRKRQKNKLRKQREQFEEKQRQMEILHQLEIEKNEKEIIRLQNAQLENEILLKTRELADTSMHLVEKQDALLKVKENLQRLYKNTQDNHDIKKTLQLIADIERNDESWDKFANHFDEINNNFLQNLSQAHPKLTSADLKLCTYLELRLSSKEIAQMINISVRGVEIGRYRLRKKLGLQTEDSITDYLAQFRNKVKR